MQQTVGTEAVALGAEVTLGKDEITTSPTQDPTYREATFTSLVRPSVQNLGPGDLFIDFASDVSAATGFKLGIDEVFQCDRDITQTLYAIASEADTDVRLIDLG